MTVQPTFVRRSGVDLAVFEYGTPGTVPLVLLHGWPDTHELWDRVIPLLAGEFHIFAIDNRGAGASSSPRAVAAYRVEELAADLFTVVDTLVPGGRAHVLAHDWGSVVGWEAVFADPAGVRVASFTSVSGPSLDHLGVRLRLPLSARTIQDGLTQAAASWYTFLFQIPRLPNPVLRGLADRWPRFLRFMDGIDPAGVAAPATLRTDIVNNVKLYRANILRKLARPDRRQTTVPVQLILARGDRAVRPAAYTGIEALAPDLRRAWIPSRHWSPISHPDELARLTTDFVRSHSRENADK
jgi:pimeloyl-ACP methyl ester carboxylesterase